MREFMVDKTRNRSELTHEDINAAWAEIAKLPVEQVRKLAKDMGETTADKQSKKKLIANLSDDMKQIIDIQRRFGGGAAYQLKPGQSFEDAMEEFLLQQQAAEDAKPETPEQLEERVAPPPLGGQDLTGIKKAIVNDLRKLVGLPEIEQATPETVQEWVDSAAATLAADPLEAVRLVNELAVRPRSISEHDAMLLQFRYRQLANELEPFVTEYIAAVKSKDPVAIATAATAVRNARHAMTEFEEIIHPSKTTWGRTGVALQQLFRRDFSLEAILRRGQESNHGESLSAEQTAELTELANKYKAVLEQLEAEQRKTASLEHELASQRQHEKVVKNAPSRGRKRSDAQKEKAKKKAALWKLFTGEGAASYQLAKPPEGIAYQITQGNPRAARLLVDFYRDEMGVTSFAELMGHVRAELGDKASGARGMFQEAWKTANEAKPVELPELDLEEPAELTREARRIQRALVESGMIDRDEVIDAVHEVMQEYIPDFTRRQTMDALSAYGQFSLPSEEDVTKRISQMNAEVLKLSQIDQLGKAIARAEELRAGGMAEEEIGDVLDEEGLLVSATGFQRRKPHPTLRELTKQYNDLKKDLPPTTEKQAGKLQSYIDSRITALTNRIADYQKILDEGDFAPKPKKPVRVISPQELKLKRELEDTRHEVLQKYAEYHLAHLHGIGWTADKAAELAHLSRALMTSFDLSAVLRQGGLVAMGHPEMATKALYESLKSILVTFDAQNAKALGEGVTLENLHKFFKTFDSRQAEFDFMHKITNTPEGEFAVQAGLSLASSDEVITRQEEAFQGRCGKMVPGVAVSSRQYTMVLNKIRIDLFNLMVRNLGRNGQVTLDEAKIIAAFVNVTTGRSVLGKVHFGTLHADLDAVAARFNMAFFAPRYVISRFQYLAMPFYLPFKGGVKANWRVKRAIYKEMGRTTAGIGITLGAIGFLASLFWDDDDKDKPQIELDPRSSDFLKVRIGDARLDFLAGLQQTMVLSARMVLGGTKSTVTGKVTKFGEGNLPQNRLTTLARFGRTKLAPIPGTVTTMLNDWTNVVGQKETAWSLTKSMVTPLSLRDIYETMQQQGVAPGAAMGLLSVLGVGMNTYGPKTQYVTGTAEQRQEQFEKDLERMKWDSPAPAYSEFLTPEQMEKVGERREEVQGNVIANGLAPAPDREEHTSDKTYQQSLKEREMAATVLREMKDTLTYEQASELLQKHYKYKRTPGYIQRENALNELYGK